MTNSTPLTERQQYWFQLPNGAVVAFSGNVDAAILTRVLHAAATLP